MESAAAIASEGDNSCRPMTPKIPIIVLTTDFHSSQMALSRCIELGASGFLQKPLDEKTIHVRVGGEKYLFQLFVSKHIL